MTVNQSGDLRAGMDAQVQATLDGLLQKRLYVAFVRPVRQLDAELTRQIGALLPEHFAWVIEQERCGRLFAAGPFLGDDGNSYPGDGMFILQASSLDEATVIAQRDPITVAGLRAVEVRSWELNEGAFTLTVRFSDGRYELT